MRHRAVLWLLVIVCMLAPLCSEAGEHRAMWANAWASGFESPSATTAYVNYTRSCNMNVLIPEIRLRADAYYASSIEPPGTGITPVSGYDSLADLVAKAHAQGMEVHPWVVTYRVWTTTSGPPHTTPEHIWYTHPEWFMLDSSGNQFASGITNLDPGVPDVENYLITVFMDIITRYDVDGFTLDYIRYPGTTWGYNPVAVARFNAEYGRTGNPSSTDPLWQEWRRDQISNLVKRLYLEIKAVKPHVKLGAAVWHTASVGNRDYFQDWDKWMKNHWIDYVSPMMYTCDYSTYSGYLNDAFPRQYGHHIYPLADVGCSNLLDEIYAVQAKPFPGVGLYCYSTIPNKSVLQSNLITGPFPTFVPAADMPWLSAPTKGYLKGFVRNSSGTPIYPATVTIVGPDLSTKNSGTGFYGFSEVTPGTYTVRAEALGYQSVETQVTITAGVVTTQDFSLVLESVPPVISNVRAEGNQATNMYIKWDTNEPATSQVDYGLTTSYGNTTAEDMALVTSHSVQLLGLQPSTTYHFRVRSYDNARNVAVSGDYTFTTAASDNPVDIIVDNVDPGFTASSGWILQTSATEKYGINYLYTSGTTQGKTATWRPTVITPGNYNVYAWWSDGTNRATNAPFTVQYNGGSVNVTKDMQDPDSGGKWQLLVANVPFAAGTSGYVRLTNNGVAADKVVIADAVRLEWADGSPPTAPTNLTANAISTTQISLNWTGSTDNVGVTGYKIYRNGVEIGTSTSNSYVDGSRTANTQYSYYVKAYDAAGNLSPGSNTVNRYTLSVAPGASSVTCDKPVNTWQTAPTFTFTATGGFGAGKVQYYRYAWTQSSVYTWSGTESQWSSGTLAQTATNSGSWYLHVKGYNGDGIANGTYTYGPYKYDGNVVGTIAQAKGMGNGSQVSLMNKVVSGNFGNFFYICEPGADQISGLRVNAPSPPEGNLVYVSGTLYTIGGERVLTSATVEASSGPGAPTPLMMTNKALGGESLNPHTEGVFGGVGTNNIGLLVTISGRVTYVGSGFVYVDDGSALEDGSSFKGVKVDTSTLTVIPEEDDRVLINGISSTEISGTGKVVRLLRPRRDADVINYHH